MLTELKKLHSMAAEVALIDHSSIKTVVSIHSKHFSIRSILDFRTSQENPAPLDADPEREGNRGAPGSLDEAGSQTTQRLPSAHSLTDRQPRNQTTRPQTAGQASSQHIRVVLFFNKSVSAETWIATWLPL